MSSPPAPGSARGDRCLYSGRHLLGTLRSTKAGIVAFAADGKRLGTFADAKAAKASLITKPQQVEGFEE